MESADRLLLTSNSKDYLSYDLFLVKQSVKQVILCFFLGNYLSYALFLFKQSV